MCRGMNTNQTLFRGVENIKGWKSLSYMIVLSPRLWMVFLLNEYFSISGNINISVGDLETLVKVCGVCASGYHGNSIGGSVDIKNMIH